MIKIKIVKYAEKNILYYFRRILLFYVFGNARQS